MSNYTCLRCNYKTDYKNSIKNHLDKKKKCNRTEESMKYTDDEIITLSLVKNNKNIINNDIKDDIILNLEKKEDNNIDLNVENLNLENINIISEKSEINIPLKLDSNNSENNNTNIEEENILKDAPLETYITLYMFILKHKQELYDILKGDKTINVFFNKEFREEFLFNHPVLVEKHTLFKKTMALIGDLSNSLNLLALQNPLLMTIHNINNENDRIDKEIEDSIRKENITPDNINEHFQKFANNMFQISSIERPNESTMQKSNESTMQKVNESTIQKVNESTIQKVNENSNDITNKIINRKTNYDKTYESEERIKEKNRISNMSPEEFREWVLKVGY